MDGKRRIALVETRTQGNDGSSPQLIRYQGENDGSASLELDDGGRVISYEEYYPYGNSSYQAVRSAVEIAAKQYRYTVWSATKRVGSVITGDKGLCSVAGEGGHDADPLPGLVAGIICMPTLQPIQSASLIAQGTDVEIPTSTS